MNASVASCNTATGGAGVTSNGTPKKGILKYKKTNDHNSLTNESDPYSR